MFWVMIERHLALLDQLGEGAMAGIRLGLLHRLVGRELAPPGLVAHLLRCHEVVEVDRLVLGPDAARRAEIGNARLRRDARTCERHDPLCGGDQLMQAFDVVHVPDFIPGSWRRHGRFCARRLYRAARIARQIVTILPMACSTNADTPALDADRLGGLAPLRWRARAASPPRPRPHDWPRSRDPGSHPPAPARAPSRFAPGTAARGRAGDTCWQE